MANAPRPPPHQPFVASVAVHTKPCALLALIRVLMSVYAIEFASKTTDRVWSAIASELVTLGVCCVSGSGK